MKELIKFLLDNNVGFDYRASIESQSVRISYDDYCMNLIEISAILTKEEILQDYLSSCNLDKQISIMFSI